MAADTFTSSIGIIQQGTGNNNNNWGVLLDAGLQVADDAIAGYLLSTVSGGTLDLSGSPPPAGPSQARHSILGFTGTLTADQTVIVPSLTKSWIVANSTNGNFVMLLRTPSGTAVQIPQLTQKVVTCYGSQIVVRLDGNDVGRIEDYAGTTVPPGTLECDGSAYSRTRYPDLFAKIGTTWGLGTGGDGTTFGVPNFKDTGRFRRSRTAAVAVGTYQANQLGSHTHTGQATGTTDNSTVTGTTNASTVTGTTDASTVSGTTDNANADHTHTQSGTFTSGTESATHTHDVHSINLQQGTGSSINGIAQGSGGFQIGNVTLTESATHTHNITISGQTAGISANHQHTFMSNNHTHTFTSANHQHTFTSNNHIHTFTSAAFTTSATGGSETRPEAAIVLTCIRY